MSFFLGGLAGGVIEFILGVSVTQNQLMLIKRHTQKGAQILYSQSQSLLLYVYVTKKTRYMGIGITNHSVGVIVTSYKSSKRQQLTVHTDGSVCHLSRVKGDIFQLTNCLQYYSLTKQFHNSLPERPFMCIVHCEMCELTSKLIK